MGNQENTVLDKMIANVLETRFDNFDPATVRHAKDRIMDAIGCALCGAGDSGNPELLSLVRSSGGNPEAPVLVYGDRLPIGTAAMLNSIFCRSFDFEPVSPLVDGQSVPGHISGTTVMTALTLGEAKNISGRELLTALLVGDDMATRILIAGKVRRGFDHVGQANSFGATAIAGRLLGLSSYQLRNAFGLVLDHLGGAQQMILDTATGFKLSQGTSARDAIFCVQLAQAGWTGARDALLADSGYYCLFTEGIREPEILTRELGRKYYSDGTFKPYPCCRINHAAIDCVLALKREHEIEAQNVAEVILHASPGALKDVLGQPFKIGDFPHASAGFSLQYNVASTLLRGSSRPEHFSEKAIRDPLIADLVKKITMATLNEGNAESARIKIILKDGRAFEQYVEIARGDPRNPLSREELIAKFWSNIEFSRSLNHEKAERVLDLIENIEGLESVRTLVGLLTP